MEPSLLCDLGPIQRAGKQAGYESSKFFMMGVTEPTSELQSDPERYCLQFLCLPAPSMQARGQLQSSSLTGAGRGRRVEGKNSGLQEPRQDKGNWCQLQAGLVNKEEAEL